MLDGQHTETEAELETRLEAFPVHGERSPFVRSLLRKQIENRTDAIAMLLEVLSPARFLPAYWQRFGLPDLVREFDELNLKNRVEDLRPTLGEEIDRLRDRVNDIVAKWMEWRQSAVDAGIREAVARLGLDANGDHVWQNWMDKNRTLKEQWSDCCDELADVVHYMEALPALIEKPSAETAGKETRETPTLTEHEVKVLDYLYREFPQVRYQNDIAATLLYDRNTVSAFLDTLMQWQCVTRPKGKQKGYVITPYGQEYMQRHFA